MAQLLCLIFVKINTGESFVNFGPLKSQLCICIWGSTKCLYLGVHKVSVFGGPQSVCIWGSTKYLYLGVHKVSVFGGPQSICIWGSTKYLYLGVHKSWWSTCYFRQTTKIEQIMDSLIVETHVVHACMHFITS